MKRPRMPLALSIALLYMIPSALWILFSDQIVRLLLPNALMLTQAQTLKGWAFVGVSTLVLFIVLRTSLRKQEQASAELWRQKTILECQTETSPDGILVVGPDGQILSYNQRFIRMWNIPPDVMAGGHHTESLQVVRDLLVDPDAFEAQIRYLYDHRDQTNHTEIVRTDGQIFDRHSAPVRDDNGTYYGRVWYYRDVTVQKQAQAELHRANAELERRVAERTEALSQANRILQDEVAERKRTEAALRESQRFNQNIADTVPALIYVYDIIEQKNIYVNREFTTMLGYSEHELRAMGPAVIPTLIHPDDREHGVTQQLQRLATAPDAAILEVDYRMRHASGDWRWLFVRETVFTRTAAGQPQQVLGVAQDITERKLAEEQLRRYADEVRQSAAETRQFAYIVSHDLRAPLVNLKGFATELEASLQAITPVLHKCLSTLDADRQQVIQTALQSDIPEALAFIGSSVSKMDHLINALLKLSRLGRRELYFAPVDMQALVDVTLRTLAHQIELRQARVTVGSLPTLVADETAMEQIMGNVLNNAVLYLHPSRPGVIEITAETTRDTTTLRIRDNGRGIAPEDMDKVFAPFRRAVQSGVPGEGMGLAYVQVLVRRHGGHIWCESQLDVGTTFFITLPNQPAKEPADA